MMIQREQELRWLTAALRTGRRGAGVVVAVKGAAGTGRTSFVREARRLVEEGGGRGARGREARRLVEEAGGRVLATRALKSERSVTGELLQRLCGPATRAPGGFTGPA